MSAVLTPYIYPEYLRSLIQEELKPMSEELRKTKEELRKTQEKLERTQEELRQIREEKKLLKTQCLELLEDKEYKAKLKDVAKETYKEPEFNKYVDIALLDSDSKVLSRIQAVEIVTGLKKSAFEEHGNKPTIPEQLNVLAERINNNIKPIEEPVVPKTSLERKAVELVECLKEVKQRNGEIFLTGKETIHFLRNAISEDLRIKDIQNPRQAKRDILLKAKKLFSDVIVLDKKKKGNRDVRIVYKPINTSNSLKRMDTYIRF